MLQKTQITNEAMKILEKAAEYRQKGFRGSDEFKECYNKFCKATGDIDTSASNFKVYVLKYGVRDKMIYTKDQFDIAGYRAEMMGRYYANR